MNKKISALAYGMTFAGCYLGAGYVSGRELWQFFAAFGSKGIIGIILTLALFFFFGIILLKLAKNQGIEELDVIIVGDNIGWLKKLVATISIAFLFGVFVVMSAGAGALLEQLFFIPKILGSFIFCAVVATAGIKGISGMVSAFSLIVPALVASAVIISIVSITKGDLLSLDIKAAVPSKPLIKNWFFASLTFLSYNFFGSIGILLPFAKLIKKRETIFLGTAIGCLFLFFISIGIILSLFLSPYACTCELPMLYIASSINIATGYIYAVLLLCAMFGKSLSILISITRFSEIKKSRKTLKKLPLIVLLSFSAWLGSFAGFGNLIGLIYPIFGYFGFFALAGILYNYIISKPKQHKKKPLL